MRGRRVDGFGNIFRRQPDIESVQLEMAEGLPVSGESQATGYQPGLLQPRQVHMQDGSADLEVTGELADVPALSEQRGHDPAPSGMIQGRDHHGQPARRGSIVGRHQLS